MSEHENSESEMEGVSDFRNPPFIRKFLPDTVQKFLMNFVEVINSGVIPDILQMYEETFPQIIEHYFNKYDWPDASDVADVIKNKMFIILYKELYYGQMCQRSVTPPEFELRIDSFLNYCDFFNLIIATKHPVSLELPEIWLWELMDEFISQFQNYTQYRSRFIDKDPIQINKLCLENQSVWSILCVLNVLHTLINISKIHAQLFSIAEGGDGQAVAGKFGKLPMYKSLGIFALVVLSRLHCILGDYYLSIKVFEPLLPVKSVLQLPACQISAVYHISFSFLMARRYADPITGLMEIITEIQRNKQQFSTRAYQNARLEQTIERIYHLLALCLVLQSQKVNENFINEFFDARFQEGIVHLQAGNLETFRLYFLAACPDIIVASPPTITSPMSDYNKIALEHHLAIFMSEVRNVLAIKEIKAALKPYSTVQLEKIRTCIIPVPMPIENDWESILVRLLSCKVQNIARELTAKVNDDFGVIVEPNSELDFYIDNNMVHMVNTYVGQRYGEYYLNKFSELCDIINKVKNINIY